ncbi:MAG: methylated-DNA--[protein]-cysteine S-methyltransferase [Bacillota bacterium]|jgi:methylated-DNA-[protein]-cysteine S-methyltransferase
MKVYIRYVSTPLGKLLLAASERGLTRATYEYEPQPQHSSPVLEQAALQVQEWFAGARTDFDLPLDLGGTEFQRAVWRQLRAIPRGEYRTYGEIARALGKPGAARAVGAACGANPLLLIIPCHRVLAKGGGLGGFSSGLDLKEQLLQLEGINWQ